MQLQARLIAIANLPNMSIARLRAVQLSLSAELFLREAIEDAAGLQARPENEAVSA